MGYHSIRHFRAAADIATDIATDIAKHASAIGPGPDASGVIGELESRRRLLGWSVAELGARCGIDAAALNQWESADAMPRLDAVERWAAALGLHVVLAPAEKEASPGLRVDWPARRVTVDGKPIRLTPMEWKALERLARTPGQVVTHRTLFHHLYGEERDYRAQSTAIRVLITKLRRLLPLRIEAQWGKGYVLTGLASSPTEILEASPEFTLAAGSPQPAAARPPCERRPEPLIAPPPAAPAALTPAGRVSRPDPRTARQPTACRAEELGVIERFLAERGVTRCPDVGTIERAPLPTLVWDKTKRKWVRPTPVGGAA